MEVSKLETIEGAGKEYKKLLEEGWTKRIICNSYFQLKVVTFNIKVFPTSAPFDELVPPAEMIDSVIYFYFHKLLMVIFKTFY